jgi:hypothetical protein
MPAIITTKNATLAVTVTARLNQIGYNARVLNPENGKGKLIVHNIGNRETFITECKTFSRYLISIEVL